MQPEERFWNKVQPTGFCWLWTAATQRDGYGRFGLTHDHIVQAHRFAYERLVGPIPDGMELDHLCRVRRCVNPDHLEVVTHAENMQRGIHSNSLKLRCLRGHEYTTHSGGKRYCNTCRKERYAARTG